jgi:hypothetical protein
VALKLAPADARQVPTGAAAVEYAAVLEKVAQAASADGRKDVAALFDSTAGALHSPPSPAQVAGIMALRAKAAPTIAADCGTGR